MKGKTIILANPNTSQQKTIILRTVGADGNTILQQVPISSVSGLQNITTQQTQQQQGQSQQQQQIPALVPTSYVITSQNNPQIIANLPQTQNQQGTRLLLTNNANNQVILPQGLTLIQRPGQQAQLVQTIQPQQQQQSSQIRIQQQPQIVQIQTHQNQAQQQIQMQQVIYISFKQIHANHVFTFIF